MPQNAVIAMAGITKVRGINYNNIRDFSSCDPTELIYIWSTVFPRLDPACTNFFN